ncbi:molecular chaperone [Deinococcus rubellus]|uniref:Fimbria/pilus periplasmic chaperone n=1 Tax=Deinococcus rubellus TaxID=1889240 RepID=A0ABY5YFD0_9DEIO|nr:fimbria/pilus periplasmic chaperone [Deinococcus rubellus]UWX63753.1 fimbria/pilus periplasmic chaperone [Deinococcus rubellus]
MNMRKNKDSIRKLLALLFLASVSSVSSQGLTINPPTITINPVQRLSTQTQLTNTGANAEQFTVKVVSWTMQDSQNVYSPSRDLVVNPSSFSVKPGETQVIRIGLLKKPGAAELAYRVMVTQVPNEDTPTTNKTVKGVEMSFKQVVSFGLAVYVTGATATPNMSYQVARDGNDLLVRMTNAGNRHQVYGEAIFKADDRSLTLPSYAVLTGVTYTARLKDWGNVRGPLTLSFVNVNGETKNETLALP